MKIYIFKEDYLDAEKGTRLFLQGRMFFFKTNTEHERWLTVEEVENDKEHFEYVRSSDIKLNIEWPLSGHNQIRGADKLLRGILGLELHLEKSNSKFKHNWFTSLGLILSDFVMLFERRIHIVDFNVLTYHKKDRGFCYNYSGVIDQPGHRLHGKIYGQVIVSTNTNEINFFCWVDDGSEDPPEFNKLSKFISHYQLQAEVS